MEIINLTFEEPLFLLKNDQTIKVTCYQPKQHGLINIGIDAPKTILIRREEVAFKHVQSANRIDNP